MSIDKLAEFAKDGDKNLDNLDVSKGFLQSEKPERQWFNKLFGDITGKINEVVDNIDAIPFEGGVLADTFVTVTPFNGAEARTQRDVNQELLESSRLLKASEYLFIPSPATDHTQELKDTLEYCFINNLRAKPIGNFNINSKVIIKGAFDGSRATFTTKTAIPIALEVSTGIGENPTTIVRLADEETIILPNVINGTKPVTGWVGQGIGVRYVNVQNTKIVERLVENFAIGVQATAYVQGCGYNTVTAGYLRNNKVNRQFTVGDAGGWTNRWDLMGGRYFHSSAEGTSVEGVIHFDVVPNTSGNIINDINHFGGSLEGVAEQYHMRLGGTHINFWGIRLETSAAYGGIKVHLASGGIAGQGTACGIHYGRGVTASDVSKVNITADEVIGVPRFVLNSTYGTSIQTVAGVVQTMQSTSSSLTPVISVFDALAPLNSNAETDYSLALSAFQLVGKRRAETYNRVELDFNSGAMRFGRGISAPTSAIETFGASALSVSSNWIPKVTGAHDLGIPSVRWNNVYAVRYMFSDTVGAFYGAGTPEGVVAAGVGSTYHRTDGAAGTCFYVKETGAGKTGWVAK